MNIFLFLWISAVRSLTLKQGVYLTSSLTPTSFHSNLSQFALHINISSTSSEKTIQLLEFQDFLYLIDATFDQSLFPTLDTLASQFDTVYFSMIPAFSSSFSPFRYFLHGFYSEEAEAIAKLMKFFNWQGFIVACASQRDSFLVGNELKKASGEDIYSFLSYNQKITEEVAGIFVRKLIKTTGIRKIVVVDESPSVLQLENGIKNNNLLQIGTYVVFSSRTIPFITLEDSLIIVESGLEFADSEYSYEIQALQRSISEIVLISPEKSLFSQCIRDLFPSHTTSHGFSIVNIQNSSKKIVGSITETVAITETIFFPGNTTSAASPASTKLIFSIANGIHEAVTLAPYPLFEYLYYGANYAVYRSNLLGDIPNFHIELYPTDCGNYIYDPVWYTSCLFPSSQNLGLAYLTNFWYTAAASTYIALSNLNINIPQISPFSQDSSVDNQTAFPHFLKLSVTSANFFSAIFIFIKSLGWENIVVFSSDDSVFSAQYFDILKYSSALGIKIANPADKRIFPSNYTRENFEEYRDYYQAAKDTRCRVFIIAAFNRGYYWEGLYDIGLREGDVIIVTETTAVSYLVGVADEYLVKRIEIMVGALAITYKEWNGELGEKLKDELSALPSLSYLCMTYDTVSVVKEAINYMLLKGNDYEDPTSLGNTMRSSKITGCLGSVFFGTNDNSRSYSKFSIQQIRQDISTSLWVLIDVAYIDKFSAQIIILAEDFVWPLNNSTIPENYRLNSICPFDAYTVQNSFPGKLILYVVSSIFLLLSIFSAVFTAKHSENRFELLEGQRIMSFADMTYITYFVFQYFQILAVGPDQATYKYLVNNIQKIFSLEVDLYFELKFQNFWVLFYVVFGICGAWVLMCFAVIRKWQDTYSENLFCGTINCLANLALPLIGHIGFLPIFSMLINIFECSEGVGANLEESFLGRDCRMFCYQDDHILFAVSTCFLLLIYLPTAIYCRKLWEITQDSLSLHTNPSYLSILSIFQVLIVISNKVLKPENQIYHGYLVSSLILLLIFTTIKTKPYNYTRVTVFQVTSLSMSLCGILTSTIFRHLGNFFQWILSEFVGFGLILIIGLSISKKFPEKFYTPEGKSVSDLFRFQCCKRYSIYVIKPEVEEFSNRNDLNKFSQSRKVVPTGFQ